VSPWLTLLLASDVCALAGLRLLPEKHKVEEVFWGDEVVIGVSPEISASSKVL
jgi:hypothetical protein